jgi:hypothetical protein
MSNFRATAALAGVLLVGAFAGTAAAQQSIQVPDGNDTTLGAKADSAWTSGSGSVVALLKAFISAAQAAVNVNTGNAAAALHVCGSHITINPTTATDTQLVAISGSQTVYVCDYSFSVNGAAVTSSDAFYLESNTSTACGGTLAQIDTEWFAATTPAKTDANPFYRGLNSGSSNGVCLHTTQSGTVSFSLVYDRY